MSRRYLPSPSLTNIGIVHPQPGFHDALRAITLRTGTLLIIDETHTICAGPGGYTRAYELKPDMLTLGKPIAAGVPAAVYGLTEELAARVQAMSEYATADTGGIGGTLAGNALSLAAMRATLSKVLTEAAYHRLIALADRFTAGVQGAIRDFGLPLACQPAWLPCRVLVLSRSTDERRGSRRCRGWRAGAVHASGRAQSRHPDDAFPQYGLDRTAGERSGCRSPFACVPRERRLAARSGVIAMPTMLAGQVALVTGAGSPGGIGFAIARRLLEAGADVAITATTARIKERAEETETSLGYGKVMARVADLTDPAAAEALALPSWPNSGVSMSS
jgi:3-oxoacyl-ACP reductase-like protein